MAHARHGVSNQYQLSVQQIFYDNNNEHIKSLYMLLCGRKSSMIADAPHIGPAMRKLFLCH